MFIPGGYLIEKKHGSELEKWDLQDFADVSADISLRESERSKWEKPPAESLSDR